MSHTRSLVGAIGLTVASMLVGCVPAEQYAGMKMKADQLAAQVASDQGAINAATNRADLAEKQLVLLNNSTATKDALTVNDRQRIDELTKDNEEAQRQLAAANERFNHMSSVQSVLPTQLNRELEDFAAKNPDVIDFDAARGVVKFKSDVTFAAGDATVTSAAKPVLTKFASILNSAGTESYELLVAGHTDSTPVTNRRTIEKGNFDNWYLSAHRAIAVGKELLADGVVAKRIGVVGYADQRPIASNSTEAGKAQNRRVEVLILPTTSKSGGGYASSGKPRAKRTAPAVDREAIPAKAVIPNKDTPAPVGPPVLNK